LASYAGDDVSRRVQPVRYSFAKTFSICPDWLVLVRGNASARDRSRSGRRASARRPLYLPASDRVICDNSLGCSRLRSTISKSPYCARSNRGSSNRCLEFLRVCSDLLLEE
jgi:hypothetical protein